MVCIYCSFILLCVWSFGEGRPVPLKLVDMTYAYNNHSASVPGARPFQLIVRQNGTYNGSYWLQFEDYSSETHVGTHMDAPCYMIKGGKCVDQIPIERLMGPAAVIDVVGQSVQNRDYRITIEDLQKWEIENGESLDGKIILFKTGWGQFYNDTAHYLGTNGSNGTTYHNPGLSPGASQWLVNYRNVLGVGTDAFSIDIGISVDMKSFSILLGADIYVLVGVSNMDLIPANGASLFVLPMKIENASAAPTRIIATFPVHLTPKSTPMRKSYRTVNNLS